MKLTISIPSFGELGSKVRSAGRKVAEVAQHGYEGSVSVPSAKTIVDGTLDVVGSAAKTVASVRVRVERDVEEAEPEEYAYFDGIAVFTDGTWRDYRQFEVLVQGTESATEDIAADQIRSFREDEVDGRVISKVFVERSKAPHPYA